MFKPTKILIFRAHHFIGTQSRPEFCRKPEAVALSSKQYPTLRAPTAARLEGGQWAESPLGLQCECSPPTTSGEARRCLPASLRWGCLTIVISFDSENLLLLQPALKEKHWFHPSIFVVQKNNWYNSPYLSNISPTEK